MLYLYIKKNEVDMVYCTYMLEGKGEAQGPGQGEQDSAKPQTGHPS